MGKERMRDMERGEEEEGDGGEVKGEWEGYKEGEG